ncbi:DUF1102 domain-containing protein [Halorubrum cibi]|uniref:DUF1102 domain-containing protein n=1 Tax=Halorubrum cibi TaxID=413815 RepID=UPI00115F1757|nr:DUF1102 domain-containing protein [Halorubrum cibi]
MANRRKFIAGLGALATGSAAAMGTGAFSFMNAQRTVSVNVTGDSSAFLGIETSQSKYATESGGTAEITLNSDSNGSGDGINANADTRFDNVLVLRNNGDRDVSVSVTDNDDNVEDVFQVWVADSAPTTGASLTRIDNGTTFILGEGEAAHLSVGTFLRNNAATHLPDQLTFSVDSSIPNDAVEPQ